jgi:hypothetical protein
MRDVATADASTTFGFKELLACGAGEPIRPGERPSMTVPVGLDGAILQVRGIRL